MPDFRSLITLVETADAGMLVESVVPEPMKRHLLDAISHADAYDQGWTLADFEITYLGLLSPDEIGQHDDLSSWVEVSDADDLPSFRNGEWDQPASVNLPPIIIITAPDEGRCHTQLGDGRGRVNFAVAHRLRLHTYHMVFKGCHTTGTLAESLEAVHRTSRTGAAAIRAHGFSLDHFGSGAGAGTGEPAGVYLSLGDGADFGRENDKRNLGLTSVLRVRADVSNVLRWQPNDRLAFTKAARYEFAQERFGITQEDAGAVIRYITRILKDRPDLEKIADWLDTKDGERELALFLNQKLRAMGYDAVEYRDPWQGVEQLIVLDPSKVAVVG